MYLELLGLYLYSYLAGSVPTAYLIARIVKGIDIREYGSGNVGGSNVIRQLGKKWAIPLAGIEFGLKGLSPVLLAYLVAEQVPELQSTSALFFLSPLIALAGNNWSVFLGFQGGRGLMVVCGMLIALAPLLFLVAFTLYLVGWRVSKSSAVWALIALLLLPILPHLPGGVLALDWAGLLDSIANGLPGQSLQARSVALSWLGLAILGLVVAKRLLSNTLSLPGDTSRSRVLLNRLIHDRDVENRESWVNRAPDHLGEN